MFSFRAYSELEYKCQVNIGLEVQSSIRVLSFGASLSEVRTSYRATYTVDSNISVELRVSFKGCFKTPERYIPALSFYIYIAYWMLGKIIHDFQSCLTTHLVLPFSWVLEQKQAQLSYWSAKGSVEVRVNEDCGCSWLGL